MSPLHTTTVVREKHSYPGFDLTTYAVHPYDELRTRESLCMRCRMTAHCRYSGSFTHLAAEGYINIFVTRCPYYIPDEFACAHALDAVSSDSPSGVDGENGGV